MLATWVKTLYSKYRWTSLMSLEDRTQVWTQRRKWIRPCVYLLQTTSQTSRSYRTKKEKRAARAKFAVYLSGSSRLTFSSVAVMITFVVARNPNTFLIKTPATFFNRYMSFKIQSTKRITSFLWKPTFEWKEKNRPCISKKQPELNELPN